jgi:hypothetical protein
MEEESEMIFEDEEEGEETEKAKKKKGKKSSDLHNSLEASGIGKGGSDANSNGGSRAGSAPGSPSNGSMQHLIPGVPLIPGQRRQVLKRTETKINEDGSGVTTVAFILDPGEIQSYVRKKEEKENPDMRKGRKRGRRMKEDQDERFMTAEQKHKKLKREAADLKKQVARIQAYNKFLGSDSGKEFVMSDKAGYDEEGKKIIKCKACGLAGHMRTNSQCPMFKKTARVPGGGGGGSGHTELNRDVVRVAPLKLMIRKDTVAGAGATGGLKLNIGQLKKQKEREQKKKRKQREEDREDEYKKRPPLAGATRMKKTKRLPLVQFNVLLEQIFYEMWNDEENSLMFQLPVDPKLVTDYLAIVKDPISLKEILEKIHSFTYCSKDQFVADVKLMVANCAKYNGAQHALTAKCSELLHAVEDEMRKESMAKKLREFEHLASLPILG